MTMPDVPSLRGVRRAVEMWERLGLRKEEAVQTIVNRADKRTDIQAETAAKIAGTQVVETRLPAVFRGLEAAANQRDPELAQSGWTSKLEQLAVEPAGQQPAAAEQPAAARRPARASGPRAAREGRPPPCRDDRRPGDRRRGAGHDRAWSGCSRS
ncbi:hypothetical protein GCM10025868_34090 [Angustibacter aerolatus]|uniref:Uncharacterized protein n=1 Tax=Angustibacter aerolatus TaxID=1162965 RepID=A0ABQ6JM13_9ACTN|nr:hypothetical protein [Angustibacter aerolatus]GMA88159.1 hypothetical protein GCM10025868_34090 [Angustibacter aerolatus]